MIKDMAEMHLQRRIIIRPEFSVFDSIRERLQVQRRFSQIKYHVLGGVHDFRLIFKMSRSRAWLMARAFLFCE